MTSHTVSLARLIGSRICHDLISPVGAIQNGIELLALEGKQSPEMALIEDSVRNASAKIRFMRVAFGLAGAGQNMGRPEIDAILADYTQAGRLKFDWQAGEDCTRATAQELFLALLCFEAAMPRGGTVTIVRTGGVWSLQGPAEADRPNERLWQSLAGKALDESDAVLPAHVQFALLPAILAERGVFVQVEVKREGIELKFPA